MSFSVEFPTVHSQGWPVHGAVIIGGFAGGENSGRITWRDFVRPVRLQARNALYKESVAHKNLSISYIRSLYSGRHYVPYSKAWAGIVVLVFWTMLVSVVVVKDHKSESYINNFYN